LNNKVTLLRQEYERKAFEIQKNYEKQMKVRKRTGKAALPLDVGTAYRDRGVGHICIYVSMVVTVYEQGG
jgi:hypothetical protein